MKMFQAGSAGFPDGRVVNRQFSHKQNPEDILTTSAARFRKPFSPGKGNLPMTTTGDCRQLAGQVIAGALSCALLGFLIEAFGFWNGPHPGPGIRLPWIGPAAGAAIGTLIGLTAGGVRLRGLAKHAIIGVLWGIVAGLFVGAWGFPLFMLDLDGPEQINPYSKELAGFQLIGIPWGICLGMAGGLLAGCVFHGCRKIAPRNVAEPH
ncbi:MAG: hypothetical protein KDA79_16770 [Planctomycetaceae bacterium]|nr:hypothetical protein [Planctomycetaceae bacterium]